MGNQSSKNRKNQPTVTNDDDEGEVKDRNSSPSGESTQIHRNNVQGDFWKAYSSSRGETTASSFLEWSPSTQKDLNDNLVTPIILPTTKSSTKSMALHFIKSKISRIFNFRKTRTNTPNFENIGLLDLNGNPISPIKRNCSKYTIPYEKLSSENTFSRPISEEMAPVHVTTIFAMGVQPHTAASSTPKKSPNNVDTPPSSGSLGDSSGTGTVSTSSSSSPVKPATIEAQVSSANVRHATPTTSSVTKSKQSNTPRQTPNSPKSRSNQSVKHGKRNPQKHTGGKKGGCCVGHPIAPPVYLDYGSACRPGGGRGGGVSSGNAILNRLKNVDVIEELKYHVPGGDSCGGDNSDPDFEYYYQCNECGEMEPCQDHGGTKDGEKTEKPVTYSRRQRFNFGGTNEGDDDGPPFAWSNPNSCTCPCCRAGLRRNPNCQCRCCRIKGRLRVSNSFDEIPVGKNPEPQPCICLDEPEPEAEDKLSCENLLPKNSGVYFYDADQKKFVRQEIRTPTPIFIECSSESQTPQTDPFSSADDSVPDLTEVIRCIPPLSKGKKTVQAPEPVILPVIYGGCCDMGAIVENLEAVIRAKGPAGLPKMVE